MRRVLSIVLILGMCVVIVAGCSQQAPSKNGPGVKPPMVAIEPQNKNGDGPVAKQDPTAPPMPHPDDKQEKYETALAEALTLMAEQKLPQALVALETARSFADTEFIKGEIAKVKSRIDQDESAKKTVQDIETVLEQGKAADAAKLAQDALREFGDGAAADRLIKLRLEAEALQGALKPEEAAARFARFSVEAEAALKEKNLRAAALAFEQALQVKDDPRLREQLAGVRAALDKYDSLRKKAAQERKDPAQLEDALAALQEAAKEWDTLQIRQEIDECTLALQKRRENVSVADFEIRGDIGLAEAGRTFAEEMLPHFKAKFDLVERGQVSAVIQELKFDPRFLDDPEQQRELGKVAKVRYLVLGSVSRLAGITVNARLVDVRTGLIVQTGKVSAPTAEQAVAALPELAKQLLMSDEEKLAWEQQQLQLAKRPELPPEDAPLPPAPQAPGADLPPPPEVVEVVPPPEFGGLRLDAFANLPPPPPLGGPPPALVVGAADVRVKHRLLHAVLHLGDNHFRRGHYREAHRHFEFALQIAPGHFDVGLRIARVRPLLPPPPVVVVQPVVILPPRDRVAILNFLVAGDPRVVPPALGSLAAYHLTPYFRAHYDVVDPGEVYWYMARMGMTLHDLMVDPSARRWLGRALGVRYFVLGTLHETASFDANIYMLDAEFGFLHGSARTHVRSPFELRLRLPELARLVMMSPADRARILADAQRFDLLLVRGRQHMDRDEFSVAITVFEDALRLRPGNVEVLLFLNRSRVSARQLAWAEQRRQHYLRQRALEEEARRRQWELARAAELARFHGPATVVIVEDQRRHAQTVLVSQARLAVKTKNFSFAISTFESALRVAPPRDEIYQELAFVRVESEKAARLRAAEAAAVHEAALRKQREQELLQARLALEAEQKRAALQLALQQKAQLERDQGVYQRSFDEAQRLLARGDYDTAIGVLQLARPQAQALGKTDVLEALLQHAVVEQAKKTALAKGDTERKELEAKLALERERRKQAELDAKRNRDLYQQALGLAQKALAAGNFDVAQTHFQQAGKVFQTDEVLSGLRKVDLGRADLEKVKKKAADEQQKSARVQKLLQAGNAALAAQKFQDAVDDLSQAKKLAPDNLEVLTALTKAEQSRDKAVADALRKGEEKQRQANFQKFLKSGQENLTGKQYDAAVLSLTEALRLSPDDATAKDLLARAQKGQQSVVADAKSKEEAKKKAEAYQKLFTDGRLALQAKRYDDAIQAFSQAQKILPGDKAAQDFLSDAQAKKKAAEDAVAAEAKKRAEDLQRAADVKKHLDQARTALAANKLADADKALKLAAKLEPKDQAVLSLVGQLLTKQKEQDAALALQKKRLEQHQLLLGSAKKAFDAKRLDDALKFASEANALVPDDKAGMELLRLTQKALAQAKTAEEAAQKQKEEQARSAKLKGLLEEARTALKGSNFDAAAKALAQAQQMAPKDAAVLAGLRDLDAARAAAGDAAKKLAAFQQAFGAGQKAFLGKDYPAAVKSLTEAVKLNPSDTKAAQLLQQAQKALADAAKMQEDLKKKQKEELARKDDYQKLMKQAGAAMNAKQFADAQKAYGAALKLYPSDPSALAGQRDATQALDAAKKQPPKDTKPKDDKPKDEKPKDVKKDPPKDTKPKEVKKDPGPAFSAAMQKALVLEKQKKYEEAWKSFEAALKLDPDDAKAKDGAKRNELAHRTLEGQKFLDQGKFAEAVREFEAALRIAPKNPTLMKLLERAKQKKK
ncbi:MAG: tetratricopeptide repeat protein [Gemmataceae bacterium]|nr:tetratricopeptide repeat protein [Gemmataceae bacterium]